MSNHATFPDDFLWGCSTSAFQVEGAASEDGKGPSIWDTFSHQPGCVAMDHNGDVAVDQYHRYRDDIALMKWLGLKAHRFSISWSRVFPSGYGSPNEKGISYYERFVDELLANGITPFLTMFHWDLPQSLHDEFGGWESRETPKYMAEYAAYVTRRLSDRVAHFLTTNEFSGISDLGYADALYAPGLRLPRKRVNQVRHHALLAHGLAATAIRANARRRIKVGCTEDPVLPVPVIGTEAHIKACRLALRKLNAPFSTAVLDGTYLDSYLAREGANAPEFTDEDMRAIGTPLDFFGMTMYRPTYVRAADSPCGFEVVPYAQGHPLYDMDWIFFGPEVGYWAPRLMTSTFDIKELYVTENGCACRDKLTRSNEILDTDRLTYLRGHLASLSRAVAEGIPVRGYFIWSFLDNFEWELGYTKRFGIVYVNYATLERIPKLSAHYYRAVIRANTVV